jgi:hypothetical protein
MDAKVMDGLKKVCQALNEAEVDMNIFNPGVLRYQKPDRNGLKTLALLRFTASEGWVVIEMNENEGDL